MKRTARRVALACAALLAGFAAFMLWASLTTAGLRFVLVAAEVVVPGTLRIGQVDGRFIGPLAFESMDLELPGFRLSVQRVEFDWTATALTRGRLEIEALRLVGVELALTGETSAREQAAAFDIPDSIRPPLEILIHDLSVENASLLSGPDVTIYSLESMTAAARFDERLELTSLVVTSPQLDLEGQFGMGSNRPFAVESGLDWIARPASLPAVAGTSRLSGTVDELVLSQSIAAPYDVEAELTLSDPWTEPTLSGDLDLDLSVGALGRDLPIENVVGRIGLEGSLIDLAVSGALRVTSSRLDDTEVDFQARYQGDTVDVASLRLHPGRGQTQIELEGRIGARSNPEFELTGGWTTLQWPLSGTPLVVSPAGRLELTGTARELRVALAAELADGTVEGSLSRRESTLDLDLSWLDLAWRRDGQTLRSDSGAMRLEGQLDDYRLTLDAAIAVDPGTEGGLRASGRGSHLGFELENMSLDVLGGTVEGRGAMSWDSALSGDIELALSRVDTSLLAPAWPGRIDGRVDAGVSFRDGRIIANARDIALAGTVRGREASLLVQGLYDAPNDAAVDRLDLRIGESLLTASGHLGADVDFKWEFRSPGLEDIWPTLGGALATTGRITGVSGRYLLEVDATGVDLELAGARAGSMALAANLGTSASARMAVDLLVRDASIAGQRIENLAISGSGDSARHDVLAALDMGRGTAELALTGRFDDSTPPLAWAFDLNRASVSDSIAGEWTLSAPSAGRIAEGRASIEQSCWQGENGEALCAGGGYSREGIDANFAVERLPLGILADYLPTGAILLGTIDGTGTFEHAAGLLPQLDVALTTSEIWIGTGDPDTEAGLRFAPGRSSAVWNSEGLAVDLSLPLAASTGGIELAATATAEPDQAFAGSALAGELHASVADLGFVSALSRQVVDTAGSLNADLRLTGTVAEPRLLGRLQVSGGGARLPEPGIVLEDVEATLDATGSENLEVSASARSGGGTLGATGVLRFEDGRSVAEVAIQGESFEILGTPALRVLASPELQMEMTPDRVALSGRLFIPAASIRPNDFSEGVARVSPDEVIIDEEQRQSAALQRPLFANLDLELGDDVSVEGFGLAGRLAGRIQIVETPNEPTIGSGELRIEDGTYEAYRQTLDIRRGRLLFAGGTLTRPGLDIEAVRQPTDDVLVGARVRGTLERPELTLFSEPPLPRQDQLSYLLLGFPAQRGSTGDRSTLAEAALVLGLSGSDLLTEKINRSLGFDEFGIQTETDRTETAASFVLGRYLAPSLYVSYGIGLYEQVNTLRLRYRISDRWRLETESSAESAGGDVIFHFERGE